MGFVGNFTEFRKHDISIVGGKIANLGELAAAGAPGSPGFAVKVNAWKRFIELHPEIASLVRQELDGMDVNNDADVDLRAERIRTAIKSAPMPDEIAREIAEAYSQTFPAGTICAVRSSATAEDLPDAAFAGQQDTLLGVHGASDIIAAVLACWSSIFTARAIIYREEHDISHFEVGIAVAVQKMVRSTRSGVIFTLNPMNNDRKVIVIETIYGLGEKFVSGSSNADLYVVAKESLEIVSRRHSEQRTMTILAESGMGTVDAEVEEYKQQAQKLTDDQVREAASRALAIEAHYGVPQDIEYGIDEEGNFVTLQARPVTTNKIQIEEEAPPTETAVILSDGANDDGLGASPGVAMGPVRIINSHSECDQVREGDILVTEMTTPDYLPAMRRAAAIITEIGGMNCHSAIVGRELGIPVIVAVKDATTGRFTNDQLVTVDGSHERIYEGEAKQALAWGARRKDRLTKLKAQTANVRTRTKIGIIAGDANGGPEKVAESNADILSLVRAELGLANIGVHPMLSIREGNSEWHIQQMVDNIIPFARAMKPKFDADPETVLAKKKGLTTYRLTDFKTNEYANINGSSEFEPTEENPMMGERGALKFLLQEPAFRLECEAVRRVIFDLGFDNVIPMLPVVRTPEELEAVLVIAEKCGLPRERFLMMCEVPSNVIELHRFLACGIMGISDGTNDMTQFAYAADRDGGQNTSRYVAKGKTVQILFSVALVITRELGKYHGLCGQMVSDFPETIPTLVALGIDSFGVDIDKVDVTRNLTAQAEAAFVGLTLEEYQERFDDLNEIFEEKRRQVLVESPAYLIASGLRAYATA